MIRDTTSMSSSIYQDFIEYERRYQTKREGEYWGPADEKQVRFPIPEDRRKNMSNSMSSSCRWRRLISSICS